ncbi:MAG: hypothetical protein HQL51_01680 [Magnetococcales bacterium]|nr:hypothetical protein [Magnetococcales bacterium]
MSDPVASIQVEFGGAAAGADHLSAELDARPDGLNNGKTSFLPGETVYFLIYKSPSLKVDAVIPSAGRVTPGPAVGGVEKEADLVFDDADSAALPVPAVGLVDVIWLGTHLGGLTLQSDGLTVKAASSGVAVARVRFHATPEAWGLDSPTNIGEVVEFDIHLVIKASPR